MPTQLMGHDAFSWRWLDDALYDIRYAWRMWRRSPGFTFVAVLMLAVGIGVNAAVFTVTNAVVFEGFPLIRNDQLVYLRTQNIKHPRWYGYGVSYPDFQDWRTHSKSIADMAACGGRPITLSDGHGLPEPYFEAQVSANAFALVGERPLIGRDFAAADEQLGAPPVVMLSYRLWRVRYGGDPAIVGQTVRIDGTPTAIVGVMPEGFTFPSGSALWAPLAPDSRMSARDARDIFMVVARRADGSALESVRTELGALGRNAARAYPVTNADFTPLVLDFNAIFNGPRRQVLYESMWAAVGFLLLIACANLANLLLARAIGRSREISVRIALGAGRLRIVRQVVIESVMLSALGGLCGWGLAALGVHTYALAAFPAFGVPFDFTISGRAIEYLIAISLGTGLVFGLAPAFRLAHVDLNAALKDGSGSATGGRGIRRLSNVLVGGEMALTVVLLTGAGVMVRSSLQVYAADLGVDASHVLAVSIPVAPSADANIRQTALHRRLEERVTALPGVESVAFTSNPPTYGAAELPYEIDGAPTADPGRHPTLAAVVVSPGYFRTLGASMLFGRDFDEVDDGSASPVVIVNERFAAERWPRQNAVGQRLRTFDGVQAGAWRTVVGIVSNIAQDSLTLNTDHPSRGRSAPVVYLPYRQQPAAYAPSFSYLIARTREPAARLAVSVRREVQALEPDRPIGVKSITEMVRTESFEYATNAVLFLVFASFALLLAVVGLYAVVAQSVGRRAREIGIRMAIGAEGRDILTLVLKQGLLPPLVGLAIGWMAWFGLAPVLQSVVPGFAQAQPVTFVPGPVVLMLASVVGCLIPARRATRVDPSVALRHE